ncbi:class I SAM-dependent methyltransferase [Acidisphaera sp. L21]|uniref:class I SAM-dependent DNA methyltransferase n=1 Tax=Acidisphaera sp. L21 TaxID=1641851 RepID=UPI00131C0D49
MLDDATTEIVSWLLKQGLVSQQAKVLDFGCGIGRIAEALAPHCHSILGLDVSPGMISEARRRTGSLAGLEFELTSGDAVPGGPFDLILFVDSMPYIHQVGLADAIMAQSRAALQPCGSIGILNLSYGRSALADQHDAERWAHLHGLSLAIYRPFSLWDGTAFIFRRA